MTRGLHRVLIANRGEIALRAIRACRDLGLDSVAVYSSADAGAPHVLAADTAVCIGPPAPTASYLNADALIHVARSKGCDAIYPGYGFLSERARFIEDVERAGIAFVGPPAEIVRLMGDKSAARAAAAKLGAPVVPGSEEAFTEPLPAEEAAVSIGFPLLIKARAGGGGKGMRVAAERASFRAVFAEAVREAAAAFGDGAVYLERFFPAVRHIEVQIFADHHGTVRHLGERDCTIQRRHQKLVEEAPSPALGPELRRDICNAAVRIAEGVGYVGAGTIEFILEPESGAFFFIEMNTRIQVEHPVTEALLGHDLVREQLRVAMGETLSDTLSADAARGHAIELRINAEDPMREFLPQPGLVRRWRLPHREHVRLDSSVYPGYAVQPFYDSMMAKLIVWGTDRTQALCRARDALHSFDYAGPPTTLPFHASLLENDDFLNSRTHTRWVEQSLMPKLRRGQ
jgi:acetyl-CoA carboxylase biotin carboxylase subunit